MTDIRTAVCIATTGRPKVLNEALSFIARQNTKPDEVIICQVKENDVDRAGASRCGVEIRYLDFTTGLTAQRNALLKATNNAELVVFIDDDFFMHESYMANAIATFQKFPDAAVLTGNVIADGISGPGLSAQEGHALLEKDLRIDDRVNPIFNAYGCNMVINWRLLSSKNCWFDENLPLYGWQEDVDFSRQAAQFGNIYRCENMVGVHLGVRSGRVSGVRFGYSQVANQLYLIKKGTIPSKIALKKLLENLVANLFGLLINNKKYIDRRGRTKGNIMALSDAIRGRITPHRILETLESPLRG